MSVLVGDISVLEVLAGRFAAFANRANKLAMVKIIGEEYRDYMSECFRNSQSPYGEPWEPLKFRSSRGGRGQKPLLDTGLMRNACTYRDVTESGFRVVVGRHYASTHQYGAVIHAKNGRALAWRGIEYVKPRKGSTRRKYTDMIFRQKVVIPARPYAPIEGMPPKMREAIDEAVSEYVQEVLGDGSQ